MRITILFFCLFIFQLTYSQITVDRSDFGVIGDTVLLERTIFGLDSLSPGPAGASQIWDFSNLQTDTIPDTLLFLDPAGFSQSGGLSPNVNLVLKDGPSLQFIEANSNGVYGHALTLDLDTFITNLLIESTPKLDIYSFPMNFGSVSNGTSSTNPITIPFQDTLTFSTFTFYVDSIRITPTINKIDSIDGFGQLLLPGQQQYDVLRQKSTLIISLSISVLIPNPLPFPPPFIWFPVPAGLFPDIESTAYTFLTKGQNFPVLELNTDSANQILSARFQLDTANNDSTLSLAIPFDDLSIYPNPTEDILLIEGLETESRYFLRNGLGSIVQSGIIRKEENQIILKDFPSGIYILSISSTESIGNTQFRVLKK